MGARRERTTEFTELSELSKLSKLTMSTHDLPYVAYGEDDAFCRTFGTNGRFYFCTSILRAHGLLSTVDDGLDVNRLLRLEQVLVAETLKDCADPHYWALVRKSFFPIGLLCSGDMTKYLSMARLFENGGSHELIKYHLRTIRVPSRRSLQLL